MDISGNDWEQLGLLTRFDGPPRDFWIAWGGAAMAQLGAERAALFHRAADRGLSLGNADQNDDDNQGWALTLAWPAADGAALADLPKTLPGAVIASALTQGSALCPLSGGLHLGLMGIRPENGGQDLLMVLVLRNGQAVHPGQLRSLALVPLFYEMRRSGRQTRRDLARTRGCLDVLSQVLETGRFDLAALAFVNDLAERFGCEQVALMWRSGEGLRLSALNQSETAERRSEHTALLEEAGQEALSQGKEIQWPPRGNAVTLAHRAYVDACHLPNLLTLPLTLDGQPMGALLCGRRLAAFSQAEQWALRMLCDQLTRPLNDLALQGRPLLKRLGREVWKSLPAPLKPLTQDGRTLAKTLAMIAAMILVAPIPYRIDASLILKTDSMAQIGAPFDGFIESSAVALGTPVQAGDVVFTLATREILLERSAGLADIAQYSREIEKRLAAGQLVEMQIAEAQAAQAQAKMEQIDYRLAHAEVRSPIAGVVVEGEPAKNLGGPVKRGDMVVKVAAVGNLHAEIAVGERDIQLLTPGQSADIRLVSSPGQSWPMTIRRIIPAPAVHEGANTFPARAEMTIAHPSWWRPGMSGVAKIDVGWHSIGWIISRRLVDMLRLTLWV